MKATKPLPDIIQGARWLQVDQVAEILAVSGRTIFNLMCRADDPLPSVKVGKSRRVPLDQLRYWMENQTYNKVNG